MAPDPPRDQGHFGRHFRRVLGMTPAAYRRQARSLDEEQAIGSGASQALATSIQNFRERAQAELIGREARLADFVEADGAGVEGAEEVVE